MLPKKHTEIWSKLARKKNACIDDVALILVGKSYDNL